MFRIESYITPIILSHIDKYVKDFRPKDAQVSLWGGEVAFQNLDLRLDVLEDELQLPFNFVSGHIHELTIRVPWTKIASEPIQITINTIEFVLKLKTSQNVPKKDRRKSRNEIVQAPPGYMASLVNKIANNISIKLHNIILKYVEEDIVVSMNIQLLSFDSADENWNPAFIDISPTKVLLKKVINISDLTICLDKRNAMGKIDICQEPILYRCTLQARMLRKYNISSLHESSLTRIDIFTESIDLNISAQQFPMLVRLIVLAQTLKEGTMKLNAVAPGAEGTSKDDESEENADDSLISWAWNLLPSIFPVEEILEGDEDRGHYVHTGIYINNLKITFKSQEISSDFIAHSTKKIKYHPILKVSLIGIYMDSVTLGQRWFNMKGGISYIGVYPLGLCTCGKKHNSTTILNSADILCDHILFLNDSLKDETCAENNGQFRSYEKLWESHLSKVTDEFLLKRTPAIAFDIIHQVEIPDDVAHSSTLGSDLEYSNLSETYLVRAIIGSFNFKYNSSLIHIYQTLKEYSDSYDYAPYAQDTIPVTLSQLTPPSTEDYEALMADIPIKLYQLSIHRPVLEIHCSDHEQLVLPTVKEKYDKRHQLPFVSIEFENISVDMTEPIYPNRLVHTTCQLPKPPAKLQKNCYTKLKASCKNITLNLCFGGMQQNHLLIPALDASYKYLIKPDFWKMTTVVKTLSVCSANKILLKLNKPQMIVLHHLINTVTMQRELNQSLFESTLCQDIHRNNLAIIDITLEQLACKISHIENNICAATTIASIIGYAYVPAMQCSDNPMLKALIISNDNQSDELLLNSTVQFPADFEVKTKITYPPLLLMDVGKININLDPVLCDFLNYQIEFQRKEFVEPKSPRKSVVTIGNSKSVPSRKSVANRVESVHSSSEPTVTIPAIAKTLLPPKEKTTKSIQLFDLHNLAKCLLLRIDVKQCTIYAPNQSACFSSSENSNLFRTLQNLPFINYTVFKLPGISIASSHDTSVEIDRQKFPICLPDTIWAIEKDSFPWNCALSDISCYTHQEGIEFDFLSPNKTKVTVAVTAKPKEDAKENGYEYLFAIYIDTAPIVLNLSESQMIELHSALKSLSSLVAVATYQLPTTNPLYEGHGLEISENSTSPNYQSELKEFFGTVNTMSENSSDETLQEYQQQLHTANESKTSVWVQWTVAKFTIKLFGQNGVEERNFIIDMEDLMTSVDEQDVYTKIKTKIGTFNGLCKTRITGGVGGGGEWTKNDMLGIIARSDALGDNLEETFFEMTITKALTKNVHSKWGTAKKKKNNNLINTITEIMMKIQSIDLKLEPDMLATFLPIFNVFNNHTPPQPESVVAKPLSVSDLPLVFFQSKGIRIFVPMLSCSPQCNVLIFKINKISIMPSAENPLYRKPVRGDIYTKAAQLRILNIPGSKIEDRQYEIMFNTISLGSGKWEEILRYLDPCIDGDAYNVNPAFDWNNLTVRPSIEVNVIFNRFTVSVTYAPCIIFENILVCGQCLEINCVTDLILELTTHEVLLLNSFYVDIMKVINQNFTKSPPTTTSILFAKEHKSRKLPPPIENNKNIQKKKPDTKFQTDSGFESFNYSVNPITQLKSSKMSLDGIVPVRGPMAVPFDVSFVGGVFSFKLYHIENSDRNSVHQETDNEEDAIVRRPLLSATLFQANFLISQSVIEKTTQLSLFDLNFKLGTETSMTKDVLSKFDDILFETRPGLLDQHGIQPPLFKFKEHIRPNGEKHLDIQVKRPIKIKFSSKTLEKVLSINKILQHFTITETNDAAPIPITTSNKIKILKSKLFNANRFEVSIDNCNVDCSLRNIYSLSMEFSKYTAKVEIFDYPQRILFDVKCHMFCIRNGLFVLLHPMTVATTGSLTKESWKKTPIVSCHIVAHCVDLNIGPENILNCLKVKNAFQLCLEQFESEQRLIDMATNDLEDPLLNENLTHIRTPPCSQTKLDMTPEHYQDDLRAGAFQFIDSDTESSLPLPYQIQIISKGGGIICWRYPQPRALSYLQIFPIPFHDVSPSHTANSQTIKCNIEYYSDAHSSFLPYCDFNLSEKEIQELELPKRKCTAEIWRIVVLQTYVSINRNYFQEDSSSDDDEDIVRARQFPVTHSKTIEDYFEEESTANLLNLHPRALVGCMRIDSYFDLKLVPSFEIAVNCSHLAISLKNDKSNKNDNADDSNDDAQKTAKKPMPDIVRQYTETNKSKHVQTFFKFYLRNLKSYYTLYDDKQVAVDIESMVSCNILEYSYMTMQPLVEEFCLKMFMEFGDDVNAFNVVSDDIRLRYGQAVGHTLAVAEQVWRQALTNEIDHSILFTRYIICNSTTIPLIFGQYKTHEAIFLKPRECHSYAFRSDKFKQQICISTDVLTQSFATTSDSATYEPVLIANEGTTFLRTKDSSGQQLLVVKIEKISSTQKLVKIKAQIEFVSMTQISFHVQYKVNDSQSSDKLDQPIPSVDFALDANTNVCVVGKCNNGISQCIKLRLAGSDKRGWSGEIPLHKTAKNLPWLVKVPTTSEKQYISFWVKVMREDISDLNDSEHKDKQQRLLIVIWPLFMIRSLLAADIDVMDLSAKKQYRLAGKGTPLELEIAGTHETEHDILFDMKETFKSKALLSYKAVDRNKFFADGDKFNDIDSALGILEKPYELNWPCSREEEMRWHRDITKQDQTTPTFKCQPSSKLSSSLMLDVMPWCLFINSIEHTIKLTNSTDMNCCIIHPNHIAMPFVIPHSFTLSISYNNDWITSAPVYINGNKHKNKYGPAYNLPEEGSVKMSIQLDGSAVLCEFQLTSFIENGHRIFILSPNFVIYNLSTHSLQIWSFCILQKERQQNLSMPEKGSDSSRIYTVPMNDKFAENQKGLGLIKFHNLSCKNSDVKNNQFNYFITIRMNEENAFSMPILVNKPINRICFSLPCSSNGEYIPLALAAFEHQGQIYVSIHNDHSPAIEIENKTELPLHLAQAESCDAQKTTVAMRSVSDEHFDWFAVLPANTSIFYTPPSVNLNFPDKLDTNIGLIFARINEDQTTREICWSRPVKIYESKELFLNLPLYGDIKVIVNYNNRKTIQITLENINYKMEFNVKDIRTKILHPSEYSVGKYQNDCIVPNRISNDSIHSDSFQSCQSMKSQKSVKRVPLHVNLYLKGIYITLYTDNDDENCIKTDVLSLYLDDIIFLYNERSRSMEATFSNIQIDNQLYSLGKYDFPVVLCAQQCPEKTIGLPTPHNIQSFRKVNLSQALCAIRIQFYENDLLSAENVFCNLQPIRAYIEDKYIKVLVDFMFENMPGNIMYRQEVLAPRELCEAGIVLIPKAIVLQTINLSEPFKLRHIRIDPLSVLLSVHTSTRIYLALDHSPLDFAPFERQDIYTIPMRFGYNIGMHYVSGAIFGAGWVFGSLEILGSPSGLARSVSIGLRDFLSMPVQGFLRGPWGLLVGITQGSASLLRNITAGTVNSVTKLAASVARNLDRLSLDEEHLQRTEALRRSRPQGITDGFAQGLTGLGISILGAVGGLARHPLEAQSSVGVVTGFGRGLVGAVTKPISGAAELVALTGQGMLQTVGFNTLPLPREQTLPRNCAIEPSASKIDWKYLPAMFDSEHILFSVLATLETRSGSICVAITNSLIVFIALETDELIEIFPIDCAVASINLNDPTLVSIKLINNFDDEYDDVEGFQYDRVLQFVRDSSDQLPIAAKQLSSDDSVKTELCIPNSTAVFPKPEEYKISFFMDEHLATHLVNYIQLVKCHLQQQTSVGKTTRND